MPASKCASIIRPSDRVDHKNKMKGIIISINNRTKREEIFGNVDPREGFIGPRLFSRVKNIPRYMAQRAKFMRRWNARIKSFEVCSNKDGLKTFTRKWYTEDEDRNIGEITNKH